MFVFALIWHKMVEIFAEAIDEPVFKNTSSGEDVSNEELTSEIIEVIVHKPEGYISGLSCLRKSGCACIECTKYLNLEASDLMAAITTITRGEGFTLDSAAPAVFRSGDVSNEAIAEPVFKNTSIGEDVSNEEIPSEIIEVIVHTPEGNISGSSCLRKAGCACIECKKYLHLGASDLMAASTTTTRAEPDLELDLEGITAGATTDLARTGSRADHFTYGAFTSTSSSSLSIAPVGIFRRALATIWDAITGGICEEEHDTIDEPREDPAFIPVQVPVNDGSNNSTTAPCIMKSGCTCVNCSEFLHLGANDLIAATSLTRDYVFSDDDSSGK